MKLFLKTCIGMCEGGLVITGWESLKVPLEIIYRTAKRRKKEKKQCLAGLKRSLENLPLFKCQTILMPPDSPATLSTITSSITYT